MQKTILKGKDYCFHANQPSGRGDRGLGSVGSLVHEGELIYFPYVNLQPQFGLVT